MTCFLPLSRTDLVDDVAGVAGCVHKRFLDGRVFIEYMEIRHVLNEFRDLYAPCHGNFSFIVYFDQSRPLLLWRRRMSSVQSSSRSPRSYMTSAAFCAA